jgi:hypothetical protein
LGALPINKGNWKDNQKEGFGVYYYTGNQLLNRYEGPWKAGTRNFKEISLK